MASINVITLLGHLGQKPEIKMLTNGEKVATMQLATSEQWKDKTTGEKKERTQWHRVVVWPQGLVKIIEQYLDKGDMLHVTGQLEHRSYEDNGVTKYISETVLRPYSGHLVICRSKSMKPGQNAPLPDSADAGAKTTASSGGNAMDDEIPF